jgi:mRNA-degrading endonuclease RelE of RelBE toxin-antitoxin system
VSLVKLDLAAHRDLKRMGAGPDRKHVAEALRNLDAHPDTKPLRFAPGWRRARVGDYRILYRPLTEAELDALDLPAGWRVARVVHRRDLDRALRRLP